MIFKKKKEKKKKTMSNQPHYWESPLPAAKSNAVGRSTSIPAGARRRKLSNAGMSEHFEDQILSQLASQFLRRLNFLSTEEHGG